MVKIFLVDSNKKVCIKTLDNELDIIPNVDDIIELCYKHSKIRYKVIRREFEVIMKDEVLGREPENYPIKRVDLIVKFISNTSF